MRKSSPSWTMIGKQKRSTKEPTPGPGDYTITSTESIKFPVTTSQRKDISPGRESPGPGAYSPSQASSSPKITFPKSIRKYHNSQNSVPGPGDYNLPESNSSIQYTILGKDNKTKKTVSPGPGSYDPSNSVLERAPSFKIGRSKRIYNNYHRRTPGPGAYSLDFNITSGPSWKIGSSKRNSFYSSDTPGPGMYNISPPKGVMYTISPSKSIVRTVNTPGPGAYNPIKLENRPKAIFGTGKREYSPSSSISPGPAAYSPEIKESIKASIIGSSKRIDLASHEKKPGPGDYFINSTIAGPSFSIRKRLPQLKRLVTPVRTIKGPGAYNTLAN